MEIKEHIAREGQDIYGLAILLYGDIRGVEELTRLNKGLFLDLDATDYQGSIVYYDDDIKFTPFVSSSITKVSGLSDYVSIEGQSIYDVAIQLYGSLSDGLSKVLKYYPDIDVVPSVNIQVERERPRNPVGDYFRNRNIFVATIGVSIAVDASGVFDDSFDDSFE